MGTDMTNRGPRDDNAHRIAKLRQEILENLPNGEDWLKTPHAMLGGKSPEERLKAGDDDSVRDLFLSILHIGIS